MAAGLAERERMRDLFGRHVGTTVADRGAGHRRLPGRRGAHRRRAVRRHRGLDVAGAAHRARRRWSACSTASSRSSSRPIEADGGLVNKFEGDAALCVFGAPTDHPDPAGAALRAARRICDAVRDAGEVDVGVGVACGRVWAGQVGAASRLEYTVIGDPVNEAARLTELAKDHPGRAVASEADGARGRDRASGSTGRATARSSCAAATSRPAPGCGATPDPEGTYGHKCPQVRVRRCARSRRNSRAASSPAVDQLVPLHRADAELGDRRPVGVDGHRAFPHPRAAPGASGPGPPAPWRRPARAAGRRGASAGRRTARGRRARPAGRAAAGRRRSGQRGSRPSVRSKISIAKFDSTPPSTIVASSPVIGFRSVHGSK